MPLHAVFIQLFGEGRFAHLAQRGIAVLHYERHGTIGSTPPVRSILPWFWYRLSASDGQYIAAHHEPGFSLVGHFPPIAIESFGADGGWVVVAGNITIFSP